MLRSNQIVRSFIIVGMATLLGACSQYFRSDVTSFHTLSSPISGQVKLVPMNPEKRESLEFRQYAASIAASLASVGLSVSDTDTPDYIVGFDVLIGDGREKIMTRPSTRAAFGDWYARSYWSYWNFYSPWHRDPFQNEIYARTVYHAELAIEIRTPDGEMVFEARSETDARNNSLPTIVPLLSASLFQEFPGNNGETRRIVLELNDE